MKDFDAKKVAKEIEKLLGIKFEYNAHLEQYKYTKGKLSITMSTGHYSCDSANDGAYFKKGDPLIHAGYENKETLSGGGRPCNTVSEAVNYYHNILEEYPVSRKAKPKIKSEAEESKSVDPFEQLTFAF